MNLDKGIIKHWANLFECEEAKKNGTYVAEEIGSEQVDEATIKGFSREDFETQGVIKHINDEFQRAKLRSWSAQILGSGEDFTIALTDSSSQPPNYDTEYYSADGAYDAWYEAKEYEYQEATKIAFECVDHFITHASDNLQFVTTFKDGDYDEQSRTIYKMVPKARAKKAIDDAIRNLVDAEYNQMRKIPQQKRQKFFRDHSWPRFALMAATNKEYIGTRTDGVGSYSMNGCGRMLMDMAEKIGAYSWEDFQNLVGDEDLETGFDMDDPIEKQRRKDQDAEFDDATMNIREGEKQDDNQNDADNKKEIDKIKPNLPQENKQENGEIGKEKLDDAMSLDALRSIQSKNFWANDNKPKECQIKSITITNVDPAEGRVYFTIEYKDPNFKPKNDYMDIDTDTFNRVKRNFGGDADDYDIYVSCVTSFYNALLGKMNAGITDPEKKQKIEWRYEFEKGSGSLEKNWKYFKKSEDYRGLFSQADIDAMIDAGVRIPGMSMR